MNKNLSLYRKRIIPAETIPLLDDVILYADNERIITKWNTLKPRTDIAHGCSAFLLDKGYKISKVYNHEDQLVYWYCDIIKYDYSEEEDALIVTDLLIDVIVKPDNQVKVVDLNEVAEALHKNLISQADACDALEKTDRLLNEIYSGQFTQYKEIIDHYE